MINALIIIPYPELREQAERIVKECAAPDIHCDITHAFGTDVDRNKLFQNRDIVLARGLTQRAIKDAFPRIAVLELTVSAWDILRAIGECREKYAAEKIAVVAPDSIILDSKILGAFFPATVKLFAIRDENEIRAALEKAGRERCDAIVGGLTAATIAGTLGWKACFIRTSVETLRHSIRETLNTAVLMRDERAKNEISRAILQNSKESILYFDKNAKLALYNRRALETPGLRFSAGTTENAAEEVFDDVEIVEAIRTRGEVRGLLKNIGNQLFLADIVPVRLADEDIGVIATLQRAGEIQAAETKIRKELSHKGLVARYSFDDIVHASESLASTIATARKYAGVGANVLIVGETGTGKELFAQSIHNASSRDREPFVALNCAAFPENLLESELFGYAPGAFSGAVKGGKTGLFELAHGGTMFLDEIGEMPLNLQATLLRALQEGEIRKIGDDRVIPVDVRIVAATNKDLCRKVREGKFRMDLLYRLDVLSLNIPPLRERREDIAHIARHYFHFYCATYNKPRSRLTDEALAVFSAHDWPGNTRELKNVCERLAVLGAEESVDGATAERVLALSSTPPRECGAASEPARWPAPMGTAAGMNMEELVHLADSLKLRKSDIAGMLGISRTTLWRKTKGNS